MDIFKLFNDVVGALPVINRVVDAVTGGNATEVVTSNVMASPAFGFSGSVDIKMSVWVAIVLLFMPGLTTLFNRLTVAIGNFMVWANHRCVDNIPIPLIRQWLQSAQVSMLRESISVYQETIKKIEADKR